eukprot:2770940-Pyramimonas_sp.AAC.1
MMRPPPRPRPFTRPEGFSALVGLAEQGGHQGLHPREAIACQPDQRKISRAPSESAAKCLGWTPSTAMAR